MRCSRSACAARSRASCWAPITSPMRLAARRLGRPAPGTALGPSARWATPTWSTSAGRWACGARLLRGATGPHRRLRLRLVNRARWANSGAWLGYTEGQGPAPGRVAHADGQFAFDYRVQIPGDRSGVSTAASSSRCRRPIGIHRVAVQLDLAQAWRRPTSTACRSRRAPTCRRRKAGRQSAGPLRRRRAQPAGAGRYQRALDGALGRQDLPGRRACPRHSATPATAPARPSAAWTAGRSTTPGPTSRPTTRPSATCAANTPPEAVVRSRQLDVQGGVERLWPLGALVLSSQHASPWTGMGGFTFRNLSIRAANPWRGGGRGDGQRTLRSASSIAPLRRQVGPGVAGALSELHRARARLHDHRRRRPDLYQLCDFSHYKMWHIPPRADGDPQRREPGPRAGDLRRGQWPAGDVPALTRGGQTDWSTWTSISMLFNYPTVAGFYAASGGADAIGGPTHHARSRDGQHAGDDPPVLVCATRGSTARASSRPNTCSIAATRRPSCGPRARTGRGRSWGPCRGARHRT